MILPMKTIKKQYNKSKDNIYKLQNIKLNFLILQFPLVIRQMHYFKSEMALFIYLPCH